MSRTLIKYVVIIIIFLIHCPINGIGQVRIPLSEKHRQKIEEIEDPRKKLAKYRKYYAKDSIKYLRRLDKVLKKKSDSVYTLMRRLEGKRGVVMDTLMNHQIVQKGKDIGISSMTMSDGGELPGLEKMDTPVNQAQTMGKELVNKGLPVSTAEINPKANNTLGAPLGDAQEKLTDIKSEIIPYQEYYNQYKDHLNHPDSMQAMVEKVAGEQMEQAAEKMLEKSQGVAGMEQFQQQKALAEEIRNTREKYQPQLKQLGNREFLKEEGRQKAKEKAIEFLAHHQDKVTEVQKKMGKLKRIYSKVENSNDLGTAVKKSSLKGKPFKERLFVSGNFQVINLDPFSLDFSPSLGYMFNKYFVMGIGGTYRCSFGEFETTQITIPEDQYGVNAFVQHDVMKGFFAFASYEQSNRALPNLSSEGSGSAWIPGFMAGAGKTIGVHPKIDTSIMLLYNFLHELGESPYRSPWIFKTGFQLKKI